MVVIYKMNLSPPARAAMMVAEALNIPNVQYKDVDFSGGEHKSDAYLKMNPQHTIPTLKDGDFAIWDSHAIALYLIRKYGKNSTLYPVNNIEKVALVDQRLYFDTGVLFPALRNTVGPLIYDGEKAIRPENLLKIKEAYDFTETFLTKNWIAGDDLTVADICCASTVSSLDILLPIKKTEYPRITAWLERMGKLPYYVKINNPGVEDLKAFVKTLIA